MESEYTMLILIITPVAMFNDWLQIYNGKLATGIILG